MTVNYELLQKFLEEEGTLSLTQNDELDFGMEPDIYAVAFIVILCIKKYVLKKDEITVSSLEYTELMYSVFFDSEKNEMSDVSKIRIDEKLIQVMETAFLIIKDVEITSKEMLDDIFSFTKNCMKKLWSIWYQSISEVSR